MEEAAEEAAAVDIGGLLKIHGDGVHQPADEEGRHRDADRAVEQDHAAVGVVKPQLVDDDEIGGVERHEDAGGEEREDLLAAVEAEAGDAVGAHAGHDDVEHRRAYADDHGIEEHPPQARDREGVEVVLPLGHLRQREGREREELIVRLQRGDEQPDKREERVNGEENDQEPAEDGEDQLLALRRGAYACFTHLPALPFLTLTLSPRPSKSARMQTMNTTPTMIRMTAEAPAMP